MPAAPALTRTRMFLFSGLRRSTRDRIRTGQIEAGRCYAACVEAHAAARAAQTAWPQLYDLRAVVRGRFGVHSQTAQAIVADFLAHIDTTNQLRKSDRRHRYPRHTPRYRALTWPAQAVHVNEQHLVLPMGRGRKSIVLPRPVSFPDRPGGVRLIFAGGAYELHVTIEQEIPAMTERPLRRAAGDLGQIHQIAVATDDGHAMIVSGRALRSIKRERTKRLGQIQALRAKTRRGSRRRRRLNFAFEKLAARTERQLRDQRHKGMRAAVDFCATHGVTELYIGDPHGVRRRSAGHQHNQRMSQWEYGEDKQYAGYKAAAYGMAVTFGEERGTSSTCPHCGHKQRPQGRNWHCRQCGFVGHRDLVGAVNMHGKGFGVPVQFPSLRDTTYLRPGRKHPFQQQRRMNNCAAGSSSRPDTGQQDSEVMDSAVAVSLATVQAPRARKSKWAPRGAALQLPGQRTEAHPL